MEANREAVNERLEKVHAVISEDGREPLTAFEAVPLVYGEPVTPLNANWWLNETLAYLTHLEKTGRAERIPGATPTEPERWASRIS